MKIRPGKSIQLRMLFASDFHRKLNRASKSSMNFAPDKMKKTQPNTKILASYAVIITAAVGFFIYVRQVSRPAKYERLRQIGGGASEVGRCGARETQVDAFRQNS